MPTTASRADRPGGRRWTGVGVALIALAVGLPAIALLVIDLAVSLTARGQIYDEIATVPTAPVALVLGTSSHQRSGPNLFYRPRIEAAAALFHAGRVRAVLVSGDNATPQYNEPWTMRRDLIALGVPAEYIALDYAGFRTLDSVVRAQAVFQQRELIIVSQRFHAARALLFARHIGLRAVAFAAADPPSSWYLRIRMREVFARAAAMLDLVSGRGPRFLGSPETVPLKPTTAPEA